MEPRALTMCGLVDDLEVLRLLALLQSLNSITLPQLPAAFPPSGRYRQFQLNSNSFR